MKRVLGSPRGTSGALGRTRCSRLAKCSRKRVRISFPVTGVGDSLRGEALDAPSARRGPPHVAETIVQPILPVLPELHPVGAKRIPAPIVRERDLVREFHRELGRLLLEDLSRADEVAL